MSLASEKSQGIELIHGITLMCNIDAVLPGTFCCDHIPDLNYFTAFYTNVQHLRDARKTWSHHAVSLKEDCVTRHEVGIHSRAA
jgi:hypothetical protein